MKKCVIFALVFFVVIGFVSATEEVDKVNKAMACLDERIDQTSLSFEEAVFSALADSPADKVMEKINSEKSSSESCWPSSGCTLKDTAQAGIVKIGEGENISAITDWLKANSGVSDDLTWYLQISSESNEAVKCTVNYKGSDNRIDIDSEMKLSGNSGSCLDFANSNYWLEIRDSCLNEEFAITCDESFKTNLLYKKKEGDTVFVSSETHSGSGSDSWTYESITAKCFMRGNDCDYEGSLWAAVALYANGDSVSEFAPYLRALAGDNEKYFPSAFLIAILEGGEVHYQKIIGDRKSRPEGGYWEASGTAYNKYYDTALALMAFGGEDSSEIRNGGTIEYLFANQDDSGCWNNNNLRDTAFIIYVAKWLRSEDGGGGTTPSTEPPTGEIIGGECNNGYWSEDGETVIDGRDEKGYCHLSNDENCCPAGYVCEFDEGNESESICVLSDGPYDPNRVTDCEVAGYSCGSVEECLLVGGEPFSQTTHSCSNPLEFCCPIRIQKVNCELDLGGEICRYEQGERCTGSVRESSAGECCVGGICEADEECGSDLDCDLGYVCKNGDCVKEKDECFNDSDCDDGEECVSGECVEKGSSLWFWIILLVILIGLVVLGIIYRDKLKTWWFKTFKKKKVAEGKEVGPPGSGLFGKRPTPRFMPRMPMGMQRTMQRPPVRPVMRQPTRAPPSAKPAGKKEDKDREETFRKLREMSK